MNDSNLQARILKLERALIWCSGIRDFQKGGKSRDGWLKNCEPLLKAGEIKAMSPVWSGRWAGFKD